MVWIGRNLQRRSAKKVGIHISSLESVDSVGYCIHHLCISTHATCRISLSITLCSLVIAEMLAHCKLLHLLVSDADAVSMILWSIHLMLILNSNSTARFSSSTSMTSSMMNAKLTFVERPEEWSGDTLLKSKFFSFQWSACNVNVFVRDLTSCHNWWGEWWDVLIRLLSPLLPKVCMA